MKITSLSSNNFETRMTILVGMFSLKHILEYIWRRKVYDNLKLTSRSVIDTKESDGIANPMEKIAMKSHSDHSDSGY